jgi:hypothetical protein
VLACLALGFAPAFSQAGGSSTGVASVSLNHYYTLNSLGFGVLNDTFTFSNNGTSPVQIPTLQVGLPQKVSARTTGLILSPSTQFTISQSQVNGNTSVTITPNEPTLNAGANVTVALKGVLTDVLNLTSPGFTGLAPVLVMFSPSLNVNVTTLNSAVSLPSGGEFTAVQSGFTPSSTGQVITETQKAIRPVASDGYLQFNSTVQTAFSPITVTSLVRTIVPSANGSPVVQDEFTVHSLANYNIDDIHLDLLNDVGSVTEVPSSSPPLINPQVVTVNGGDVTFTTTNIGSPLYPNSSVSLTFTYPLPSNLITVSGSSVSVTVPYSPVIQAPTSNYTLLLAPTKGITPSGQTSYKLQTVTPLSPGSVQFAYSVSVGWAADQALPAGALIFAVAFAMLAIQSPASKRREEDDETDQQQTSDVLRAFEAKMGLETQYVDEFGRATKGAISRSDFDRMRNEVTELRARAIQRLKEMQAFLGSGRQFDTLTRVAEAEKDEDRAFKDFLNLYMQYHGNRMNEETFKRLQPNYRKRVENSINRLSDLLHETQSEEK